MHLIIERHTQLILDLERKRQEWIQVTPTRKPDRSEKDFSGND